jgi:hypothetical protein
MFPANNIIIKRGDFNILVADQGKNYFYVHNAQREWNRIFKSAKRALISIYWLPLNTKIIFYICDVQFKYRFQENATSAEIHPADTRKSKPKNNWPSNPLFTSTKDSGIESIELCWSQIQSPFCFFRNFFPTTYVLSCANFIICAMSFWSKEIHFSWKLLLRCNN